MTKHEGVRKRGLGRLLGAAKAVKRFFTHKPDTQQDARALQSATLRPAKNRRPAHQTAGQTQSARITKRESDIPFDVIDRYTPSDTSSKASFRSDGKDHHDDQEMAMGVVDERWNDEDRFTNKSGDPRIGTHRRTYEPEEARAGSRK